MTKTPFASPSNQTVAHGSPVATPCSSSTTVSRDKAFRQKLPPLDPLHRRIYLVRHGQTDWNVRGLVQGGSDIELNETGKEQARRVAQALSDVPLDIVASSHLSRASETANIVHAHQRAQRAKRIINESFGEMRLGEFEGAATRGEDKDRFWEMNDAINKDVTLRFPGQHGEGIADVERRKREALMGILEDHEDASHILIVGHGRASRTLLASLMWGDARRYEEIEQGNTCINVIDFDSENTAWKPILLNYLDHHDHTQS